MYEALQRVKNRFHFHFIDAHGTPEEVRSPAPSTSARVRGRVRSVALTRHARQVRERIKAEFGYQSSLELADATFEIVRTFPLARSAELVMPPHRIATHWQCSVA